MRSPMMILVTLALGACAGTPAAGPERTTRVAISSGAGSLGATELHHDHARSRTLPLHPDSVWRGLPLVYERLGVEGAGLVPGQPVYGAQNFRPRRIEGQRLSSWIDCGTGMTATPKADEYQVTMSLLSRVTPDDEGATRVETVLTASARPRTQAGDPVNCQSNGKLEARVVELLVLTLASG